EVTIQGNKLNLTYADGTERTSMKDPDASLPETLAAYGVTPEELSAVTTTVERESGFGFWFLNLAPFLIPIIFLGFLFWFLTRQVRGTGMQAFSFGQSKA